MSCRRLLSSLYFASKFCFRFMKPFAFSLFSIRVTICRWSNLIIWEECIRIYFIWFVNLDGISGDFLFRFNLFNRIVFFVMWFMCFKHIFLIFVWHLLYFIGLCKVLAWTQIIDLNLIKFLNDQIRRHILIHKHFVNWHFLICLILTHVRIFVLNLIVKQNDL